MVIKQLKDAGGGYHVGERLTIGLEWETDSA